MSRKLKVLVVGALLCIAVLGSPKPANSSIVSEPAPVRKYWVQEICDKLPAKYFLSFGCENYLQLSNDAVDLLGDALENAGIIREGWDNDGQISPGQTSGREFFRFVGETAVHVLNSPFALAQEQADAEQSVRRYLQNKGMWAGPAAFMSRGLALTYIPVKLAVGVIQTVAHIPQSALDLYRAGERRDYQQFGRITAQLTLELQGTASTAYGAYNFRNVISNPAPNPALATPEGFVFPAGSVISRETVNVAVGAGAAFAPQFAQKSVSAENISREKAPVTEVPEEIAEAIGKKDLVFRDLQNLPLELPEKLRWRLIGHLRNRKFSRVLAELQDRAFIENIHHRFPIESKFLADARGRIVRMKDGSFFVKAEEGTIYNMTSPADHLPRIHQFERGNWVQVRDPGSLASDVFRYRNSGPQFSLGWDSFSEIEFFRNKVRLLQELESNAVNLSEFDYWVLRTRIQLRDGVSIPNGQAEFPIRITNGSKTLLYDPPLNGGASRMMREPFRGFEIPPATARTERAIVQQWEQAARAQAGRVVHYTEMLDPVFIGILDHLGL